ncbi:MAG: hypothetical protein GX558_12885 [Clostridiales bacterium]|nr:hypothetical protein [Clostridiales bacterium]
MAELRAKAQAIKSPAPVDDDPLPTPIYDTLCSIDKTLKDLLAIEIAKRNEQMEAKQEKVSESLWEKVTGSTKS